MDYLWIVVAFLCGFGVKQFGLPPLVGYLCAGFALNAYGINPNSNLDTLASLGITLMLFTIGLKINVRNLLQREVWAGASIHMVIWSLTITLVFGGLATLGGVQLFGLEWSNALLIGFALSFSSTVCVIKILEEKGELKIRHGKLAIGILIIQDIAAVAFLVAATGQLPSLWALGLIPLWFARPLFDKLLNNSGHDELLPLIGFFLALGAYEIFELVNLKGDLGALLIGMMFAKHAKASELYKSLIGFKDLFLIGFFLSIGFSALPTAMTLMMAAVLCGFLLIKFALFFFLFNGFQLRGRTSFLAALALTNYSEFGLIVAHYSVEKSWLPAEWLVILALSVTFSFIISSFIYRDAHNIYTRRKSTINRYQKAAAADLCQTVPRGAEVLVVGMGRVGTATYDALTEEFPNRTWGVDADDERIKKHHLANRHAVLADADDIDFWSCPNLHNVKLVMLAIPTINDMKNITQQLQHCNYNGKIAAIAQYEDEQQQLKDMGIDYVFSYFAEVGSGFAEESLHLIRSCTQPNSNDEANNQNSKNNDIDNIASAKTS